MLYDVVYCGDVVYQWYFVIYGDYIGFQGQCLFDGFVVIGGGVDYLDLFIGGENF